VTGKKETPGRLSKKSRPYKTKHQTKTNTPFTFLEKEEGKEGETLIRQRLKKSNRKKLLT